MTKKIKKPMSILLSLIMVVSMFVAFPVITARAELDEPEITVVIHVPTYDDEFDKSVHYYGTVPTRLGTSAFKTPSTSSSNTTWKGDYVYYGKDPSYTAKKYRVLAPSTTAYTESGDDVGKTTMLLDFNGTMGTNTVFNTYSNRAKPWSQSRLKENMNSASSSSSPLAYLTEIEKNAIVNSYKSTGDSYTTGNSTIDYVPLTGEKIFALSIDEVTNPSYGYVSDGTRKKPSDGYWLRSSGATANTVCSVSSGGAIGTSTNPNSINSSGNFWASPAFNLDVNEVMFTTRLSYSSSSGFGTYKLTMKDPSLTVAQNGEILKAGNYLIVPYTTTGEVNNVSVLITNKPWNESDARIVQYGMLEGTHEGTTLKNRTFITEGTGRFKLDYDNLSSYYIYLIAEYDNSIITSTGSSNPEFSEHLKSDYAGTPVAVNTSQFRELTHYEAVEATCEADGNLEYWKDDNTGKVYVFSEDGSTPSSYIIPGGHDWNTENITWVWDDTGTPPTASVQLVCNRDSSHTNNVTATVADTPETVTSPNCTETGVDRYSATVTIGGTEYTNTHDVTVPANGHTPGTPVEETVEPTYDEDGHVYSVVYCSVCGAEISREMTSTIPKLNKNDLSTAHLVANPLVFAYDGEEHTVSAVLTFDGTRLTKDVDYVLTGNTETETGTYTLTAQGIGEYTGTTYATWRICNVYFVTATIDGVTTTTSYEDKSTARYTSTGNGAWYVDGVLRSTNNNFAFTVLRDSDVEWRPNETQEQTAVANAAISERTKNGEKDKVTITATWSLPDGANVTQVGTARCYTTDTTPDKETVYNTGTKKTSTLKTLNGTFDFNLNIGGSNIAKTLCVVTYVEYTLNGTTQTVISDVATSVPNGV